MIHDRYKERDDNENDYPPQDYTSDLMRVMGMENRLGRIIRRMPDGKVECGGIIYKSIEEFDTKQNYLLSKKKSD